MKKKFKCNHSDRVIEHYSSMLHETCMHGIDKKFYCEECIGKITNYFVERATLRYRVIR